MSHPHANIEIRGKTMNQNTPAPHDNLTLRPPEAPLVPLAAYASSGYASVRSATLALGTAPSSQRTLLGSPGAVTAAGAARQFKFKFVGLNLRGCVLYWHIRARRRLKPSKLKIAVQCLAWQRST